MDQPILKFTTTTEFGTLARKGGCEKLSLFGQRVRHTANSVNCVG
jgi:hypothetical protein